MCARAWKFFHKYAIVAFKRVLDGNSIEPTNDKNSEEYKMYYIFSSREKYGNLLLSTIMRVNDVLLAINSLLSFK
jgi:hypothetical protein